MSRSSKVVKSTFVWESHSVPDEVLRVTVDICETSETSYTMETEELTNLVDGIYKVGIRLIFL